MGRNADWGKRTRVLEAGTAREANGLKRLARIKLLLANMTNGYGWETWRANFGGGGFFIYGLCESVGVCAGTTSMIVDFCDVGFPGVDMVDLVFKG